MSSVACTATQELLVREPEGDLDAAALVRLEEHVTGCGACRQRRAVLRAVRVQLRATAQATATPAPAEVWRELRSRLDDVAPARVPGAGARTGGLGWRPLAWAGSLAVAAAAVLFVGRPRLPSGDVASMPTAEARADYVQATDNAATLVYVDQESGWLIVWASAPTPDAG